MSATMKEVAELAGLGIATVSSYINGGSVREKNRAKIEFAIKELNFEVNEIARGLKTNKTKTIGIIIPELSSNFYAEICMKIEDLLRAYGYAIIITDSRSDRQRENDAIDFLQKKRVDGVIIVPATKYSNKIKQLMEAGRPVVLLDRLLLDIAKCGCIIIDNINASMTATQKLIDKGHRKIGVIIGPKDIYTSIERKKGYLKALENNNIPYNEDLVVHGHYTIAGGISAMKFLIEEMDDMTGVVLTNYDMTVGAIIALNEYAPEIREKISVIGFDCKDFSKAVTPKLDIMLQPLDEIAKHATEQLLKRMEQPAEEWESEVIQLNTRYMKGDSG